MGEADPSALDPDAPIPDDLVVYRIVHVDHCERRGGSWFFQSSAFDNASALDESESELDMSVVLSDTLEALGRHPGALPIETWWIDAGHSAEYGVAKIDAAFLISEQQEILRTPNREPAHGDVRGSKNGRRRKRIKMKAAWVAEPTQDPR